MVLDRQQSVRGHRGAPNRQSCLVNLVHIRWWAPARCRGGEKSRPAVCATFVSRLEGLCSTG